MTDRLFADCCYGSEQQHLPSTPCPRANTPAGGVARAAAEAAMRTHIAAAETFTYADLCKISFEHVDSPSERWTSYRWADQLIQIERKAGRITQSKRGVWHPTAAIAAARSEVGK